MSKKQATWDDLTALADGGLSANQIATRLNKADLTTPTGKRWYDSSVLVQVRSQLSDTELKKAYPQLHADAVKYDKKQVDKKVKARKATTVKAAAVDEQAVVVIPSTRTTMPGAPGETDAPVETQSDGAYAHVVVVGDAAVISVHASMGDALAALMSNVPDVATSCSRVLPVADIAAMLSHHSVQRVSRVI